MPRETLQSLQLDHLNADLYKTELDKCQSLPPLLQPSDHSLDIIIGITALITGYIIGATVK